MIALSALATMVVSSFLLIASPQGIKPDFDLRGLDIIGNVEKMNTKLPAFRHEFDSDSIELAFISPVKGVCVAGQTVIVNGEQKIVVIKSGSVNKGATVTAVVRMVTAVEAAEHNATLDGYTIFVQCSDPTSDKLYFSNFYHFDATNA